MTSAGMSKERAGGNAWGSWGPTLRFLGGPAPGLVWPLVPLKRQVGRGSLAALPLLLKTGKQRNLREVCPSAQDGSELGSELEELRSSEPWSRDAPCQTHLL